MMVRNVKCKLWSFICFKKSLDAYVKHFFFFFLKDWNAGLSLNAVWNEKEYSMTSYLQCRSCAIQSTSPCPLIGAEVTHFDNKVKSWVSQISLFCILNRLLNDL